MSKKRYKKKTYKRSKGKKFNTVPLIAASIVLLILLLGAVFVYNYYKVKEVNVSGSSRYSDGEIKGFVINSFFAENTLYLSFKYKNKAVTDIPYIEKIGVEVTSHNAVHLKVYEKALAGYVEYLGRYMYFDREGTVVEVTGEQLEDIPQILGLKFDYVVVGNKLPVENDEIFSNILSLAQLLEKYKLAPDRIFFDVKYNMYLYFGDIDADIGDFNNIEEKLEQLIHILPKLEGKSGIIRLRDYKPGSTGITFEQR